MAASNELLCKRSGRRGEAVHSKLVEAIYVTDDISREMSSIYAFYTNLICRVCCKYIHCATIISLGNHQTCSGA